MNVLDEIKAIRRWLAELNRLLMAIRRAGGAGEANTASNQGAGGVGLYNGKVAVDLQFRNINAASNKITVALDAPNKEVDIDVDPSKIDIGDLKDVSAAAPNDNDVLTWDAGGATWQPEVGGGGGGAVNPMAFRRIGRCYTTWDYYYNRNTSQVKNTLHAYPFIVPTSQDFDRIIVEVVTAPVNGVCRLGIYDDDGDVYPDNLIVDSGELDTSTIGFKAGVIAETLTPGLYWLVINSNGDTNVYIRGMDWDTSYPQSYFAILGRPDTSFLSPPYLFWRLSEAYAALPNPFTGGATAVNNADLGSIFLRKA